MESPRRARALEGDLRYPALVFVLLCVAASLPLRPKVPHKSAAVHQGAGAAALIAKLAVIVPPAPTTNIIVWQYPPSIVASNLWWNIEQAPNPIGPWTVLVTNATGACEIIVNKAEPLRAYRLSGRLLP